MDDVETDSDLMNGKQIKWKEENNNINKMDVYIRKNVKKIG